MGRQKIIAVSRSKEAYDRLREDLIDGRLMPGSKLAIAELQTLYDLGAMPIREALNQLSAELLVQKHEQRGFTVPPLELDGFLEIQNARIVIESEALKQSILNRSSDWEDRLVLAFHYLRKAGPQPGSNDKDYLLTEAWAASHVRFHRELISGCDNSWLLTFAEQLYQQSARYRARSRQISAMRPPARATLIEEHQEIMEAAIGGEVQTAVDRLVEHYRLSVAIVLGKNIVLASNSKRFIAPEDASPEAVLDETAHFTKRSPVKAV